MNINRGYSRRKKLSLTYEWKIEEFTSLIKSAHSNKNDITLKSPSFSTGAKVGDSWCLELILHNEKSKNTNFISVFLETNNKNKEISAKFTLYILKNDRLKYYVREGDTKILGNDPDWGYSQFIEKKKLLDGSKDFLPMDTLTLCVDLTVYGDYETTAINFPVKSSKHIVDDFKELFESKLGSDVVLIVGNKKIKAHKSILIARSPILAAMFTHEMYENLNNEATITDVDPDIIEKMLEFIYTDQVTDLDVDAGYLLEAADKYQLQKLKELCEESLSRSITVNNAVEVLILADRQNAPDLLDYAAQFIAINITSVIKTDEYKNIETKNTVLSALLIKKLAAINSDRGQKIK
ncbi:speckle-type POZ protein B-like [Microplitis mediator]|uniref:speckle-type POZ protein B-like n=1 Tax=Microplitis mediator TaxID=375433 RepID=UPI002556A161|nr:speckle-type POZ protein B-like [Microplitis mediator]XP_057319000.1 speckle-type POZ protein B-like [Microplitis mediator]